MSLHVSSTMCSSSGGQNCIIQHLVSSHSVGGRPLRRLREDGSSLNLRPEIMAEQFAMHLVHKHRKMSGQTQAVTDIQETSVVLNLKISDYIRQCIQI